MYTIVGPYNIRSVGSLAAETTVGILQSLYPNNQVSIKARDVPGLMSSVVEVMTCKLNPNRYIQHMKQLHLTEVKIKALKCNFYALSLCFLIGDFV